LRGGGRTQEQCFHWRLILSATVGTNYRPHRYPATPDRATSPYTNRKVLGIGYCRAALG
jgi:hypothetical protein